MTITAWLKTNLIPPIMLRRGGLREVEAYDMYGITASILSCARPGYETPAWAELTRAEREELLAATGGGFREFHRLAARIIYQHAARGHKAVQEAS